MLWEETLRQRKVDHETFYPSCEQQQTQSPVQNSHLLIWWSTRVSSCESTVSRADVSIAGADTTAVSLTFTLYYILAAPRIWIRLCDEIRSRFHDSSEITGQSTSTLVFLDAIIHEGFSSVSYLIFRTSHSSRCVQRPTPCDSTWRYDGCGDLYSRLCKSVTSVIWW
jgi:hypothetical protein